MKVTFKAEMIKRYKFFRIGLKSDSGDLTWKKGVWKKVDGELNMCHWGLHCSKEINQALGFVRGEILAEVEVRGKSIILNDKECYSEMKILKTWKWTKKDSVALAVYAAELVIAIFEKEYPKDDRPRKAIEAAKYWLKHPTAYAAYAAHAAADAAHAAHAEIGRASCRER